MKSSKLRAVVTYRQGDTARARTVTEVRILNGDVGIAAATLGGRYSAEQAVAEYLRTPGRFARLLYVRPRPPAAAA
jgi:hypothetical protein